MKSVHNCICNLSKAKLGWSSIAFFIFIFFWNSWSSRLLTWSYGVRRTKQQDEKKGRGGWLASAFFKKLDIFVTPSFTLVTYALLVFNIIYFERKGTRAPALGDLLCMYIQQQTKHNIIFPSCVFLFLLSFLSFLSLKTDNGYYSNRLTNGAGGWRLFWQRQAKRVCICKLLLLLQ